MLLLYINKKEQASLIPTFCVCLGVWEASWVASLFMLARRIASEKVVPSPALIHSSFSCPCLPPPSFWSSKSCSVLARNTKFLTICCGETKARNLFFHVWIKCIRWNRKNVTRHWSYLLSQLVFQERRVKLSAEVIAKLGHLHEVRNIVTW